MPVVTYCAVPRTEHVLQGRGRDAGGGLHRLPPRSSRRCSRRGAGATPTRRAGCRSTGTSATSRSATTWSAAPRMPRRIARRSPRGRPSSRRPVRSRGRTRATRTSGSPGRCTSSPGTCTTRRGWTCCTTAGGDWAFYNGGDRWTYGVYMYKAAKQYGMKFRLSWHWNAVGGRPVLRPGLPRGRLRLVQLRTRRRTDPGGPVRAAPRRAGRLPAAADAGPAGQGTTPTPPPPAPPTA